MQTNPMMAIMQMMSRGGNPQQILQSIITQNPQAQVIINQMQQSGMTPQQFATQYAKQNNIDLNKVVHNMRNMGAKF